MKGESTMATLTLGASYENAPDNNHLNQFPGSYGLPYIGKAIQFIKHMNRVVDEHYKTYGPISRIRLSGQNGLLVVGPDLVQEIFLDKSGCFSAKMGYDKSLGAMYPDNILLSDGQEHKKLRRLFQAAFKNDAMRGYTDMMNPVLQQHLEQWGRDGQVVFFPAIKKALLDVGAKIFIGIDDLGEEADKLADAYIASADGLLTLVRKEIPGGKWARGKAGVRYLRDYLGRLIPERRGDTERGDMLSILCNQRDEQGDYFSDADIVNQAVFLLFAAHDTTTSAISNIVCYSTRYPAWQQRMRDEARALGKAELDYEDLESREYTDRIFREVLRLYPSVPLLTRRTTCDCELGGQRIPAHTVLLIPTSYNQRLEAYWTHPQDFDPDRFSPERAEQKNHPFSYFPFGGGAHKCLGMHFAPMLAKCFLHQFVLQYEYQGPKGYDPEMLMVPLPRPADGIPLTLTPLV